MNIRTCVNKTFYINPNRLSKKKNNNIKIIKHLNVYPAVSVSSVLSENLAMPKSTILGTD